MTTTEILSVIERGEADRENDIEFLNFNDEWRAVDFALWFGSEMAEKLVDFPASVRQAIAAHQLGRPTRIKGDRWSVVTVRLSGGYDYANTLPE